jgi:hypothetical protein
LNNQAFSYLEPEQGIEAVQKGVSLSTESQLTAELLSVARGEPYRYSLNDLEARIHASRGHMGPDASLRLITLLVQVLTIKANELQLGGHSVGSLDGRLELP